MASFLVGAEICVQTGSWDLSSHCQEPSYWGSEAECETDCSTSAVILPSCILMLRHRKNDKLCHPYKMYVGFLNSFGATE